MKLSIKVDNSNDKVFNAIKNLKFRLKIQYMMDNELKAYSCSCRYSESKINIIRPITGKDDFMLNGIYVLTISLFDNETRKYYEYWSKKIEINDDTGKELIIKLPRKL